MRKLYVILLATLLLGAGELTTAAKAEPIVPQYNLKFFLQEFPGFTGIKFFDLVFAFCQQHHIPCPISP
jgi:hypothetical protein